jgi:probable O-glycosylation ligase (exosortase A-associated)
MRDIFLTLIVGGLLPAILFRPYLGAYAWAWLSLMNPHRGAWGFAATMPFAQMIAVTTLVATLFTRTRHPLPVSSLTTIYAAFFVWMSLTSLFAMNSPEIVLARWIFVAKIHTMMLVTVLLLRGRKQIEMLIWVVTISIGFYGVKGGIFTVATGGAYRVWGPPDSMVEGNNELAVALTMLIPLLIYLLRTARTRVVRWSMFFSTLATGASILGSQSRGALIALAAMLLVLGLKGKRPLLSTAFLTCLLAGAIAFMPDNWTSRMETIGTYEQDTSAMSRLYTWTTLWALALDRPITGAGFATDNAEVFARYAPSGENPIPGSTPVAHSIYFQALGEHGFPGLALYLLLGALTWRTAGRLAKDTKHDAEFGPWVPMLMTSIQISLIAFAAGGTFLTLVHFDMPYYLVVFVVLVDATVGERSRAGAAERQAVIERPMKGAHR